MKKTIAFLTVLSAISAFANTAHATPVTGPANFPSGSVVGGCTLTISPGALPANVTLQSSISSVTPAKIESACNTPSPTLKVVNGASTVPTALTSYSQSYKFVSGASGMFAVTGLNGSASDQATTAVTLSNGTLSSVNSVIELNAKIETTTANTYLPVGGYVAVYDVTMTP